MNTFRPVNTSLAPDMYVRSAEETTPTTPRPNTAPGNQPQLISRMDDATTPTRATFGASALANQRPLPAQPFPAAVTMPEDTGSLRRGASQHSVQSTRSRDSDDVDMDGSDDGEDGSDEESVNADGTRTKKKKSQRFYCTDYPPCNLSFTRSEHLARHIRKHTGERPFQCHCSRRFSRLDNLRQHAQTVHVNEEIPQDSLAATGTRFQRQVRTDRVRPPGNRSRAATAGSQTQGRGHHRNSLSASSISSVGSYREDARRRPPPLQMAAGSRLSGEIAYRPGEEHYFRSHSPGGFSTPTSATFSTGQNSPRWGSAIQSPITSQSRTQSIYDGHRTPGRRLSVPSAGNPFQSPGGVYPPPPLSGMNSNAGPYSPSSSMLTSPTTSTSGSTFSRRESISNQSDDAWRRRTWHPDTYSNFTSRLQNVTAANYYSNGPLPQPPSVPSNAPPMRLPGIESFDPLPRPQTPVRRQPSPMMIDTPSRMPPAEGYREERPNSQHWDMNRNLNRLDIGQNTPHADAAGSWATDANRAVQAQAEQARTQPPAPQTVRFEESPWSARSQQNAYLHQSAPPITPREAKRQGWYHGPLTPTPTAVQHPPIDPRLQRTSPEDSSSSEGVPGTPSSATIGEYNPSIMHSNGYLENRNGIAPVPASAILPSNVPKYSQAPNGNPEYAYAQQQQAPQTPRQQAPPGADNNMSPLDTLVAVATNQENVAATAY